MALLVTLASSAGDPQLAEWNTMTLEVFYYIFSGIEPDDLIPTVTVSGRNKQSERHQGEGRGVGFGMILKVRNIAFVVGFRARPKIPSSRICLTRNSRRRRVRAQQAASATTDSALQAKSV